MQKVFSVTLTAAMLIALVGCNSNSSSSSDQTIVGPTKPALAVQATDFHYEVKISNPKIDHLIVVELGASNKLLVDGKNVKTKSEDGTMFRTQLRDGLIIVLGLCGPNRGSFMTSRLANEDSLTITVSKKPFKLPKGGVVKIGSKSVTIYSAKVEGGTFTKYYSQTTPEGSGGVSALIEETTFSATMPTEFEQAVKTFKIRRVK